MLAAAWWFGLREPYPSLAEMNMLSGRAGMPPPPGGTLPVAVGDELPHWAVKGWINGKPPEESDLAGKVIVVDIWNEL
jgi:hypothetical protein